MVLDIETETNATSEERKESFWNRPFFSDKKESMAEEWSETSMSEDEESYLSAAENKNVFLG